MATRVAPQDPLIERLRSATSITALVRYLHDELNWPVDLEAIDDAFYDYEPEELGIKPEHQVAIKSIKQLRPLTSGQPWGIFFVEFDKQRLPMVVLRRVLQGLSLRNREKDKGRQRWHAQDLLFISSFGPASDREIALAHFTDESDQGDLPTLRVLGWDGADTNLALAGVANTLREHLRWPTDGDTPQGQQRWRQRWSSAFRLRYREAVTTAKDLALALAYLARAIRTRANEVLVVEGANGPLTLLYQAFKANLMADLTHDRFADMYAQTITYGLFAARVSRSSGGLVADDAALMIPSTNPFLQDLLQDFLAASGRSRVKGRARGTGIDFDELGVNAVVEQLRQAPMDAVLVSFNNARPGDDPVIHFYEDFLTAYDKAMRVERGVFYTPKPVVQFIVRSVHEVLQNEFGIEDGLASTITWGEMLRLKPGLALPAGASADSAFVQMLDPAVGTATFLVEIIDLIHRHMLAKWQKAGQSKDQQLESWNVYVRDHLLTRMHGFELMMAPYAIAHMKLGLKLADTGYRFPEGGPRVRVFLTNSLQPASDVQPQFELMAPMLAHEARAANAAKDHVVFTVVLGNPPYSAISANLTEELRRIVEPYRYFDGARIRERSMLQFEKNIQDDYVKFIALAERFLQQAVGVLGYITNHSYLDAPTLRGLRQSLVTTFDKFHLIDLHGNANKGETDEAGGVDQNVFAIRQGVSIAIGIRLLGNDKSVWLSDLLGVQSAKLATLAAQTAFGLPSERIEVERPLFQFVAAASKTSDTAWSTWPQVNQVFEEFSTGLESGFDALLVGFDAQEHLQLIRSFSRCEKQADSPVSVSGPHAKFVFDSRADIAQVTRSDLGVLQIRAFDYRSVLLRKALLKTNSFGVLRNLRANHPALVTTRQTKEAFSAFVVESFSGHKITSSYDRAYAFPLFRSLTASDGREDNFTTSFRAYFESLYLQRGRQVPDAVSLARLMFGWIVGTLSSSDYVRRYAGELKRDWPRIPLPAALEVFEDLSAIGLALWDAQVLRPSKVSLDTDVASNRQLSAPTFSGRSRLVQRVEAKAVLSTGPSGKAGGEVFVEISENCGFRGVSPQVWQIQVGGYQVLHKWLDDRRKAGRSLSDDDIAHWQRIYAALHATQGLIQQVDSVVERHGGWPSGPGEGGAFSLNHPPPSGDVLAAQAAARPRGRRRAAQPGQQSFLDADEEPEPARKRTARPPKSPPVRSSSAEAGEVDDGAAMCALRAVLAEAGDALARDALIRQAARALGHQRTSKGVAAALDDAIRRAVRRGIAENRGGALGLLVRDIDGYDRDHLKTQLVAALRAQRGWVDRAAAPKVLARWLGFARTGAMIVEATESLLRALARSRQVELTADAVRVARA